MILEWVREETRNYIIEIFTKSSLHIISGTEKIIQKF